MRRILPLVLLLPGLAVAQPPAAPANPPAASPSRPDRQVVRDSLRELMRDSMQARRERRQREVIRQTVTPEMERTAFADATARTLLERARVARLTQDSALRAYDAKTYQRLSLGVGIRRIGRERLFMRTESASRVRWSRGNGIWVEPLASRSVMPAIKDADIDIDPEDMAPIPYFPGRETLWFPSGDMGVARAEVNERDMLHPLATGAEAYYRYATGDSVSIRLPDGRRIALRELRITARRPEWRAFNGSFWFDTERGSLVRAAYRMAAEMDIWKVADEENKRDGDDDEVPALVKGLITPMRANITAITVEYGLYEGRFWLPKLNVAEGEGQAGFVRMPVKFEETYKYDAVNGDRPIPRIPTPEELGLMAGDSSSSGMNVMVNVGDNDYTRARRDTSAAARRQREDSAARRYAFRADSLREEAAKATAAGDTTRARQLLRRAGRSEAAGRQITRRREECEKDSTYFAGTRTRHDGAVRMAVRLPCDPTKLATSTELPGSIYEPGEAIFGATERDALLAALDDFGLQAGWSPQRPTLRSGVDLIRYNRVEGLSVGAEAKSVLGMGYTATAQARLGISDLVPNAELTLERSSGAKALRGTIFHRLGVANDDWGSPLSFGASLAGLLYGRDEGFYYRTFGAELGGTRAQLLGGSPVSWRLFAERQRGAARELKQSITGADYIENIAAAQANVVGAGAESNRTWGSDPSGWRFFVRGRSEAAWVDRSGADSVVDGLAAGYGRALLDATLSRGFGRFAGALTGAAGGIVGDATPQRLFYAGGYQTVRGQFARPDSAGYVGNAFWMARSELGFNTTSARPVVFFDLGWAGDRRDVGHPGRPLSGYGAGISFMDGLIRADLSRGLWPQKRMRFDLAVEARF
ncbi:hypothetical protein [Roseisolibacter agri]|uniref:Bacterial surface antigen (D15) domain-containing protein n=1 Tax=Roseisolibacter agri TaxID=2014610 RepID=A0AA37QBF1_9BACT|nr:hypothetical protein [Roseisolibacter agri]GLC26626.1 hypothetical protein rosag_31390 [Roseisolibacter agri]